MTRHIWPLLLLVAGPLRAVYQYEITDSFASIDTNKWYVNGTVSLGGGISSSPGDDPAPQGPWLGVQLHGTAGSIHADMTKVRQILFNLLGNACKFTKDGEITLAIGRVVEGWVQFRVFDTGIGITSSQASRLFQPFVQADASIGRQFGGTGLGFTISRRLCEMMGGSLWLGSEPGMGRCRKSSRH